MPVRSELYVVDISSFLKIKLMDFICLARNSPQVRVFLGIRVSTNIKFLSIPPPPHYGRCLLILLNEVWYSSLICCCVHPHNILFLVKSTRSKTILLSHVLCQLSSKPADQKHFTVEYLVKHHTLSHICKIFPVL